MLHLLHKRKVVFLCMLMFWGCFSFFKSFVSLLIMRFVVVVVVVVVIIIGLDLSLIQNDGDPVRTLFGQPEFAVGVQADEGVTASVEHDIPLPHIHGHMDLRSSSTGSTVMNRIATQQQARGSKQRPTCGRR